MLLKLCGLLSPFDVYFENVCFAHRALIRPLGTTITITTDDNDNDNNDSTNSSGNSDRSRTCAGSATWPPGSAPRAGRGRRGREYQ